MKNGLLLLMITGVQIICSLALASDADKWCQAFSNKDILVGIAAAHVQGNKTTHWQLDQNAKDTCTRFVTCEETGTNVFTVTTQTHYWCKKSTGESKEKALTLTAPLDSPWGNICAVAFLQTQNKYKCRRVAKSDPTIRKLLGNSRALWHGHPTTNTESVMVPPPPIVPTVEPTKTSTPTTELAKITSCISDRVLYNHESKTASFCEFGCNPSDGLGQAFCNTSVPTTELKKITSCVSQRVLYNHESKTAHDCEFGCSNTSDGKGNAFCKLSADLGPTYLYGRQIYCDGRGKACMYGKLVHCSGDGHKPIVEDCAGACQKNTFTPDRCLGVETTPIPKIDTFTGLICFVGSCGPSTA